MKTFGTEISKQFLMIEEFDGSFLIERYILRVSSLNYVLIKGKTFASGTLKCLNAKENVSSLIRFRN